MRLGDGKWHHLAGVKQGHEPATVQLFVDGSEVASADWEFENNHFTHDGGEIRLGGFNRGESLYNTSVVVDEAAIWKRALSSSEVASMYRRAKLHLGLQVRVCNESTCVGQPFVGPDGTSDSYFTEANLSGPPGSQLGNLSSLGLIGARAQYRVRFSTELSTTTPGLRQVSISARR